MGFEKSFFLGLPIPTSALTITSFVLAFYDNGYSSPYSDAIIPLIIVVSFLMISNIRYETVPKFSLKGIKEKPFHYVFILIAAVLVLLFYKKGLFYSFIFMIVLGILRHLYNSFFKSAP